LLITLSKSLIALSKSLFTFSKHLNAFSKEAFAFSNSSLLTHLSVFRKSKKLVLSQTPVCLLILVFSASKRSFCFVKPQFAYSFECFP
jgi:hypothetical protein